jgi:hypothetical protein
MCEFGTQGTGKAIESAYFLATVEKSSKISFLRIIFFRASQSYLGAFLQNVHKRYCIVLIIVYRSKQGVMLDLELFSPKISPALIIEASSLCEGR